MATRNYLRLSQAPAGSVEQRRGSNITMVTITDIEVAADDFALRSLLDEYPDADVEFQHVVPFREGVQPRFWVANAPTDAVEASLCEDAAIRSVTTVSDSGDRALFEVRWGAEANGLVQPLLGSDVEVMAVEGREDRWGFRLQFSSYDELTDFREECANNGVELQLHRLHNPTTNGWSTVFSGLSRDGERSELTDEQREILSIAASHGYWDIPREHTLGDIAALTGISPNAASQRLRRGMKTVLENTDFRRL
ncbi:helix-turn-helix domain-containing protein [Halobacteriaceae archaeon GCM10025711]